MNKSIKQTENPISPKCFNKEFLLKNQNYANLQSQLIT